MRAGTHPLVAPFPWFGGKRRAATAIWERLGEVKAYTEPFGGSAAVLLARPGDSFKMETYNDSDGFLVNFWRAVANSPTEVTKHADWPVTEADLTARHYWLVERAEQLQDRLQADPDYYDPKIAGWWVWGACAYIGSGWCSGRGKWAPNETKDKMVPTELIGVPRQLPYLTRIGQGINNDGVDLEAWLNRLSKRLRKVRVSCGDWKRISKPSGVIWGNYKPEDAGVYLDPPYPRGWSTKRAYRDQPQDAVTLWEEVKEAAIALSDRGVRVVVSGYLGTWRDLPEGWVRFSWKAKGGYGNRKGKAHNSNAGLEVLYSSPTCRKPD